MNAVGRWFRLSRRKAHLVTVETPYHLYTLCGRRMERKNALESPPQEEQCQQCARLLQRAQARWSVSYVKEIARFEKEQP